MTATSDKFDLDNFMLVRQMKAMHKDIELHKWYESEKAGHDIGWDRATVDWICKGHWKRFTSHQPALSACLQ